MLRLDRVPSPLTVGMLPLDLELEHPAPESQLLASDSQHIGHHSEHIGVICSQHSLDSEHIDLGKLPRRVRMLRKSDGFLPRKPGMMRLGGESEHPAAADIPTDLPSPL